MARLLLRSGANPNKKLGSYDTALWYATFKNEPEMVQLLLDHGADYKKNAWGQRTPLAHASSKDHYEIVRMMLESKRGQILKRPFAK